MQNSVRFHHFMQQQPQKFSNLITILIQNEDSALYKKVPLCYSQLTHTWKYIQMLVIQLKFFQES